MNNTTLAGVCGLVSTTSRYTFAAVLLLIAIIATVENAVVIIAMCKYKALRTPSMLLIGALSAVDFLTGFVVTPLYAVITIHPDVPWHKANRILMVVVVLISLLTVVYISLDRFFHVYYLQSYRVTRKRLCLGLFIFWVTPFLFHTIVRRVVNATAGRAAGRLAGRRSLVAVISMCIITMILAYGGILFLLKKHSKQVSDSIRRNYLENQMRAAKTAFLIVVSVIAMNSLAIVFSMTMKTSTILCTVTLVSVLGNSVVNPLIYCFRLPLMKKHILMLFGMDGKPDESRERILTYSSAATNMASVVIDHNVSLKKLRESVKI